MLHCTLTKSKDRPPHHPFEWRGLRRSEALGDAVQLSNTPPFRIAYGFRRDLLAYRRQRQALLLTRGRADVVGANRRSFKIRRNVPPPHPCNHVISLADCTPGSARSSSTGSLSAAAAGQMPHKTSRSRKARYEISSLR